MGAGDRAGTPWGAAAEEARCRMGRRCMVVLLLFREGTLFLKMDTNSDVFPKPCCVCSSHRTCVCV